MRRDGRVRPCARAPRRFPKVATFELRVSHRQITIFAASVEDPLSEWNGRHVAQGFTWRPQCVSFRTFQDGPLELTATRTPAADATARAARIIRVPFEVSGSGLLNVSSGKSLKELRLPGGHYDLTFEHGLDPEGQWCQLVFDARPTPGEPAVLRADAELYPEIPLLMTAYAVEGQS